ncbi:MAG: hypothetical protein ACKVU0_20665 [Saprospiraceae bacterium]
MKYIPIVWLLILMPFFAAAQQPEPLKHELALIARHTKTSIRLRWAPSTFYAWRECNKSGYTLVRYTMMRDGKSLPAEEVMRGEVLTQEPLRPLDPVEAWRQLVDSDDYAAVAAQALYGETFELDQKTEDEKNAATSLVSRLYETQNRLGFMLFAADHSWPTALALGLAYEDSNVKANESYLYRVFPAFQPKLPVDTAAVSVEPDQIYELPKPIDLNINFGDRQVYLTWNTDVFSRFFVSYFIERSEDGITWTRRNEQPFVTLRRSDTPGEILPPQLFVDSLPQNNRLYLYRVIGNSSFAESSPPSDPVQGMGIDPLPAYFPEISSLTPDDKKGFILGWDFSEGQEAKITGFKVMRADNDNGPYTIISGKELLPSAARTFTDPKPMSLNFYKVIAMDKLQREMPSFSVMGELHDATPPAVPQHVRGRVLNDGTLILSWDENKERDLLGYRVFMANDPRHNFIQETHDVRKQAYYLDTVTLATLSDKIYYRVISEDLHHNQSSFSAIAEVSRPDTIPPSPAVFNDIRSETYGVKLQWANSSSSDVQEQHLQRRRLDTPQGDAWETLLTQKTIDPYSPTSFTDSTGEPGIACFYRVEAIDDAGLRTYSQAIQGGRIDNMIRAGVNKLSGTPDRSEKLVLLTWQYPEKTGIREFVIYRAESGDKLVTYAKAPPEIVDELGKKNKAYVFAFADKNLHMNTAYQYQVGVKYQNGAISPLSEMIEVKY